MRLSSSIVIPFLKCTKNLFEILPFRQYLNAVKADKICIYGESGQGKTTLLHIVSGEIEMDNVIINDNINNNVNFFFKTLFLYII